MIKQEHMSKKSFESDPDGQKKIEMFLKSIQNDIRLKLVDSEVKKGSCSESAVTEKVYDQLKQNLRTRGSRRL